MSGFSEQSKLLISQWNLLELAEKLLWQEFRRIRDEAADALRDQGWVTRTYSSERSRYSRLEAFRPSWPDLDELSVHLQVGTDADRLGRGLAYLQLHFEGDDAHKEPASRALRRVLAPYHDSGVLLRECGCVLWTASTWRVLRDTRPLADITADSIVDWFRRLAAAASFVDEALFLADKEALWRTDFLPGQPELQLRYGDSPGGQTISPDQGRLGTPCLRVSGQQGNYERSEDTPTNLALLTSSGELHPGDQAYLSCNLRAHGSARVYLYAGTPTPDLSPALAQAWPSAAVQPSDDWQHLSVSAQVVETEAEELATQGLHLYFGTSTDDGELFIDGIEFGRIPCPE